MLRPLRSPRLCVKVFPRPLLELFQAEGLGEPAKEVGGGREAECFRGTGDGVEVTFAHVQNPFYALGCTPNSTACTPWCYGGKKKPSGTRPEGYI